MDSKNPVFGRSEEFRRGGYATFDAPASAGDLQTMDDRPTARATATAVDRGRMTLDDVVVRTATLFGIVLVAAAAVFIPISASVDEAAALPGWAYPALLVGSLTGLVLSLVISFSRSVRPPLMMLYAAAEGVFVGAISGIFEASFPGVVVQAVLGTLATFAAMLVLYRTGVVRATPRFRKVLIVAGVGYAVFGLVQLVVVLFGGPSVYQTGMLAVVVSAIGVLLAALFLVLDLDVVEQGLRNGLPRQYAWTAAFGLVVTLVWLYVEMLRLLVILRRNDD